MSNNFIWPAILDLPSWILIFFLRSQEITEIETKSNHNACEMYKLVIFWNLMKKLKTKNTELYHKSRVLAKDHENSGCHGNVKNDKHTIDVSKFPQRMNEQPLKGSAPRSKLSCQNFEKTLLQGWHPSQLPTCTFVGQGILQRLLYSLSFHCPKYYSKTLLMTLT